MDKISNETLNISSGSLGRGNSPSGSGFDVQNDDGHLIESEDTGNEEFLEYDNNLQSNLRRRKGKIISCAKETIENGKKKTELKAFVFILKTKYSSLKAL